MQSCEPWSDTIQTKAPFIVIITWLLSDPVAAHQTRVSSDRDVQNALLSDVCSTGRYFSEENGENIQALGVGTLSNPDHRKTFLWAMRRRRVALRL